MLTNNPLISYVAGGAVSKVAPDSTGLNPAWRGCLWEATFGTAWDEGAPFSEIKRLRAELATTLKKVSDIMPGAGSYLNEVCTYIQYRDALTNNPVYTGIRL